MHRILKNLVVVDSSSKYNGQKVDIEIKSGKIEAIASELAVPGVEEVDLNGASVSTGWMDTFSYIGEPGLEHQETFDSGLKAAAKGGFTDVIVLPNTQPCVQSKSEVAYIKASTQGNIVNVHPMGALSQDIEGKELTEMYDMQSAGAIAFGDGDKSVQHTGLMQRALMYVKKMDGVIVNTPNDSFISQGGQMHEGVWSAKLGMKGVPALSEELMTNRDVELAEYTESRIHLSKVSAAKTIEIVKQSKAKGVKVTCGVASYQMLLEDKDVSTYDSNYKVKPVLRSASDVERIKAGLKDGTIDVICSNHTPKEEEVKKKEFNLSESGMINYETAFATANEALSSVLNTEELVEKISSNPRRIFGLEQLAIEEGNVACLTIFDPSAKWTYSTSKSKSKNSPFFGREMIGKVLGIVNNNSIEIFG